jgi:hypothetical protein
MFTSITHVSPTKYITGAIFNSNPLAMVKLTMIRVVDTEPNITADALLPKEVRASGGADQNVTGPIKCTNPNSPCAVLHENVVSPNEASSAIAIRADIVAMRPGIRTLSALKSSAVDQVLSALPWRITATAIRPTSVAETSA